GVGPEMGFVAWQLESRGVVVEPPAEPRILRVAKVDADVLIAVEALGREGLQIALVLERTEQHLQIASGHDLLAIEPSEDPRRATAIETTAVIENPQPHPFTLEGARHFGNGDR